MSKQKISRSEKKRRTFFTEQGSQTEQGKSLKSNEEILIVPEDDFLTAELEFISSNDQYSEKDKKRLKALALIKEKSKKDLVAQLRKTPIVQLACEKTSVGRSTYYKWRAKDKIFARAADKAIEAGRFFINDIAESKLVQLIQEKNPTAIIFWLKHNHPSYTPVNKVIHQYEVVTEKISVEEENIMTQELANSLNKFIPRYSGKEMKEKIEEEMTEAEKNINLDKRMKTFEDD